MKGFIVGAGLSPEDPAIETYLSTIGERLVYLRDMDEYVHLKRGVLMGEAIAKPVLTILNLSVEHKAFCDYLKIVDNPLEPMGIPYREWHGFHIAGDDLIAHGPRRYLELITENHERSGCIISKSKHAISKVMVRYTEHILYIPNLRNGIPYKEVNSNLERSCWTDSVKVRLFEKGQSTMLKKDDKNVALGKGQQLARTLQWQSPPDWVKMCTTLFINRMGNLLPNQRKYPRLWNQIRLPDYLGGLDLVNQEDIYELLNSSPLPTKHAIARALSGASMTEVRRLLSKLNSNPTVRGSEAYKLKAELILDRLREGTYPLGGAHELITWRSLCEKFPGLDDAREIISAARNDGILGYQEFAMKMARGVLFSDLLKAKEGRSNNFNTKPYQDRYRDIWDDLMNLCGDFEVPPQGFNKVDHPNMRGTLRFIFSDGYIRTRKTKLRSPLGKVMDVIGMENLHLSVEKPACLRQDQ